MGDSAQKCNTHTHTHTTVLQLYGFCPGQPGWAGNRRNIQPLTPIMVINHPYLLHPRTMIHGILPVQSTCLQSFSTIFLQVFFGLPLGLTPSTSYSIHFFTQSLSSFRNICPYHRSMFRCSTEIMSCNPSLSLNPLLGILSCSFTPHIHLTILISACWSATSFFLSYGPGLTSMKNTGYGKDGTIKILYIFYSTVAGDWKSEQSVV